MATGTGVKPPDIGGDDDSGPVTAQHVKDEAAKNGIKDKAAVDVFADAATSNPNMTHEQVHAMYDLAVKLQENMDPVSAAKKAVAYGSLDKLQGMTSEDPSAAGLMLKVAKFDKPAGYWAEVVVMDGHPRSRLRVVAEMSEAGVPAQAAFRRRRPGQEGRRRKKGHAGRLHVELEDGDPRDRLRSLRQQGKVRQGPDGSRPGGQGGEGSRRGRLRRRQEGLRRRRRNVCGGEPCS
jgi:hypothetical protein